VSISGRGRVKGESEGVVNMVEALYTTYENNYETHCNCFKKGEKLKPFPLKSGRIHSPHSYST
jgi:hypothetical protein